MSHFFTDMQKKYDNKGTELLMNITRKLKNGTNVNIKKKYDEAIAELQEKRNKSFKQLGNKITNDERQNVDLLVTKLRKQGDSLLRLSNAIQKAKNGKHVNNNILEKTATQFEQIQKDFESNLNSFNLAQSKKNLNQNAENRIGAAENRIKTNALNLASHGGGKKKKGVKRVKGKKIKVVKGKKKVRKIHKGPRGGKYYISKGKKVYI
jgi:hypothetical protein